MSTVTTTRPINLAQLAAELGTDALAMSDDGTDRTITCHDDTVTQDALQAAVDAHEPTPPPVSFEARIQAQVDEATDLMMEMLMMGEL